MTHRRFAIVAANRVDEVLSRWLENLVRTEKDRRGGNKNAKPFDVAPKFRTDDGQIDYAVAGKFMRYCRSPFSDATDVGGLMMGK